MPYSGTITFSKLLLLDRGRMIFPRLLLDLSSAGGLMPYSGTMMFSKLLLDFGRIFPKLLLDLISTGGLMPYSGTMTFSKLLDDSLAILRELEDLPFLELLETVIESAGSSRSLEDSLTFLLELDGFSSSELQEDVGVSLSLEDSSTSLLELDDFTFLELEDFCFLELLEASLATEELVWTTTLSFSSPLSEATMDSVSQLAQKAAVNESKIFFQCLFKKMPIFCSFLEQNIQN